MLKAALVIATILSAAVVTGIVGFSAYQQKQEFRKVQAELEEIQAAAKVSSAKAAFLGDQLTNNQTRIETLLAENSKLLKEREALQKENKRLMQEKEAVTLQQEEIEQQMRSALESKEVTISELQGKLTVNIVDRVLFDSGQAQLKAEGQEVLLQIANVLSEHPNRQVYVIGHTDNVPIRASAFSRYPTNWELSAARATAAVRFLTENAGVDPARLAAVGYGEYHPIADNSTPEGRARNRRIAIVIMPEHFNPLESPEASEVEEAPAGGDVKPVEIMTEEAAPPAEVEAVQELEAALEPEE